MDPDTPRNLDLQSDFRVSQSPPLIEIFQQILENIDKDQITGRPVYSDTAIDEIIFEIDLGGIRYTLLRTYPLSNKGEVNLSPREKEIVRLVADGKTNKTIAAVLDVSPWTVATHLRRVFMKLDVSSRAEMIARVMLDGLLEIKT